MIKEIKELNFPKIDGKQYATLTGATVTLQDMGEKTITSTVKFDGEVTPDFSYDWVVEFQDEKYIMPLRKPQGAKENTSMLATVELTFQHWAIYWLKQKYFFQYTSTEAGVAIPDKWVVPLRLNLGNFCEYLEKVLAYWYGDKITVSLNPAWQYDSEPTGIDISYSKIWDVLIKLHELYGVRWQIAANGDSDHYVIRIGYPTTEVSHIFEYGFEGGLLKTERQVQSDKIANVIMGRGGEKNLPYRYFKDTDPDNDSFPKDPDWVPELANMPFTELRGATFRSYIQGWKHAHYNGANNRAAAYAQWAWDKGNTDTKFDPVEFVKDDASIAKYGELWDALDNNEDIYPTIQGVEVDGLGRIDEVVAVEEITSDDVDGAVENDAQIKGANSPQRQALNVANNAYKIFKLENGEFDVPTGKTANLITDGITAKGRVPNANPGRGTYGREETYDLSNGLVKQSETVTVVNKVTGETLSASGIPAGSYRFRIEVKIQNASGKDLNVTVSCPNPKVQSATPSEKWGNTWDIWVKDIWGVARNTGETDAQYAERVWRPILGDKEGNEAKVVFSDGWLSTSEVYEFTIVKTPAYDTSKSLNGVPSHWRITLAKSDADLESLGLYVPSTKRQATAGDHIFFVGIDMPHQYVVWAEIRLDDWKKDHLGEVKDIKPTWVVGLDKVRIHNYGKANALIENLKIGNSIRLADKRFILNELDTEAAYETLYLQSVTYTYTEPTDKEANLLPDVEVVLSDKYETTANPVSTLQGEVSALSRQVGSISNVEQIVRMVGDKLYLRKDGIPDRSMSPTEFASLLTSLGFRSGMIGGAGWGIYKDENGRWVIEADRLMAREDLTVNSLVINQVEGQGGTIVESAARMEITAVEELTDGYKCYFDQHEGTVANLFHVDDVAWNSRFTPENAALKSYRRRVTEVGADYVVLSKTDVNGTGIPAEGDAIVQRGNYTDKTRQFIKVRDVIGGGYERYIEGLDSVNAEGTEYYFVGKQDGQNPRWFVGHKDLVAGSGDNKGSNIEYKDNKFNLNNVTLSVTSTIGDKTIEQYIKDVVPPVTQEDIEGFVNAIVNPKLDGIQDQIDGAIETFFAEGVPTLTNYPASEWTDKDVHLGDLYYDRLTGIGYRFGKDEQGVYSWDILKDTDVAKALADAAKAQDTADGKRRVFTAQPTTQQVYDVGDLWVNATYGTQYSDDILRCVTHKDAGVAFSITHWTLASKYTDDTALNTFIQRYETEIKGYKDQLDGKVETWYYAYDPTTANKPASDWTTDADKAAHAGDLFYNTVTKKVFRWTGTAWESMTDPDIQNALDAASAAQDTADNKRRVFMTTPTTPYDEGDLWIDTTADGKTLKVCTAARATGAFASGDWVIADDASLNVFATTIETSLNGIRDQLDQKAETWYQSTDPSAVARPNGWLGESGAEHKGDLWFNTTDNTTWYWDGTQWQAQNVPDSVFDKIDGKADVFVSQPTSGYHENDLWFLEADYTLSGVAYKAGTLVVAKNNMGAEWSANDWIKKDRYTDATDIANALKDYEYLTEALKDVTTIQGGLMMTGLVRLGQYNSDITQQVVWAGINGVRTNDKSIAAWYGGDMLDKENGGTGRTAKSLFRMDGSGYLADGNITWNAAGAMTFGSGIVIDLADGNTDTLGGLSNTLANNINLLNNVLNCFEPQDSGNNPVGWDSPNIDRIKVKKNFYSMGFVSAKGMNPDGTIAPLVTSLGALTDVTLTGLAAGQALVYNGSEWVNQTIQAGGIDEAQLSQYLTDNSYATQSWVNTQGFLKSVSWGAVADKPTWIGASKPSYAFSEITGKPTTLAGYGITDAKIANGVITLGGNTITPLTSHQSLANYVTLNTAQTISALKTITAGLKVSGRISSGDDEGIVISPYANGNAGLCLGDSAGKRSVFYFKDTSSALIAFWRFSNGSTLFDIIHPAKSGTIALTADIPTKVSQLTNDSGYATASALSTGLAGKVSKTGDTMSGLLKISHASSQSVVINSTTGSETFLRVQNAGSDKSCFGWHPTYGTYIYHSAGAHYIGIRDNGSPYFDSSLIWHAGNDGAGSGLDADLLDGKHNGELEGLYLRGRYTGSGGFQKPSYFVGKGLALNMMNTPESYCDVIYINGYNSSGNSGYDVPGISAIAFKKSTSDYGSVYHASATHGGDTWGTWHRFVDSYNIGSYNAGSATKLQTARTINGTSFDGTANITTASWGTARNIYIADATAAHTGAAVSVNGGGNATLKLPATITAALSGNASTATTLQTTRTLWGQNFNGGANVSGSMTGVVDITASGLIKAQRFSGTNIRIECDNSGAVGTHSSEINNFNSVLYLQHQTPKNTIICTGGGNVGIGTTSPSYKLDVAGDIRAQGWLWTSGATGWYNETYGGGWYMEDSTWIRSYNGKHVYISCNDWNALNVSGAIAVGGFTGTSWNDGYGAVNIACYDNQNQTPLIVGYRVGTAPNQQSSNRMFAMELHNNGQMMHFSFSRVNQFEFSSAGVFVAGGGIESAGYITAKTANSSSDARLKDILGNILLDIDTMADAPSVRFKWKDTGEIAAGSIAQYWQPRLPEVVSTNNKGYYTLGYGVLGTLMGKSCAVHLRRHEHILLTHESRITRLERENREMRQEINELKRQLLNND